MSNNFKSAALVGAIALASTQLVSNRQALMEWFRPAVNANYVQAPPNQTSLSKTSVAVQSGDVNAPDNERKKARPMPPPQINGVERIIRDKFGSYYVDVYINGALIHGMIDTGASVISLTDTDARRVGFALQDKDYTIRMSTANGFSYNAPVELKAVRLGSITISNVRASVAKPGALSINLIGMSFLNRLKSFETSENTLILRE